MNTNIPVPDWHTQTGKLPVSMTNDYLFHILLQENNRMLKALIASVLHYSPDTIKSAEITNPIEHGKTLDEKTFILDVKVLLNNSSIINLEMQVVNYNDWPERSLVYLCRAFDSITRGSDYTDLRPVVQISFLNFPLFEDEQEFCSTFKLININTGKVYTDKFSMSVVYLPYIENATAADIAHHVSDWAAMFKAKTWEDLKMLAAKNPDIEDAITTTFHVTQDDLLREEMERREEYIIHELAMKNRFKRVTSDLKKANEALVEKDAVIADMDAEIANKDAEIARLKALLAEK